MVVRIRLAEHGIPGLMALREEYEIVNPQGANHGFFAHNGIQTTGFG